MNQLIPNETDRIPVPSGLVFNDKTAGCIQYLILGFRFAMKSIVKEAVKEVIEEQNYNAPEENKTLTARELCERWNISANTLRNWEIDKKIAPLPLKGRKKIYSMKDVLAAEAEGYIKTVA